MQGLILGGGAIGLSLAYELAKHGVVCRVLDKGPLGCESSWAGAGIIPASKFVPHDFPLEQLAGLSAALHPEWAERLKVETGIDNGYRRCGGIYVARDPEVWHALELLADDWYGRGISTERLTTPRLRALAPELATTFEASGWPQRLLGAYYTPDEAQVRNPWHLRALVAACQQRGVELLPNEEVQEFMVMRGEIRAVVTRQGAYSADFYVVTAGAWTSLVLQQLGLVTQVRPVRGQIVVLNCGRKMLQPVINEGPRYLVPRDDGRVLVGSTEEHVGFVKATTAQGIEGLLKFARELAPTVAAAPVETSWSGLRPGTADGLPYLGTLPGVVNGFVAAGHFRAGLHLSPGTAVVLSELIRGVQPQIDLRPFRCDRHLAETAVLAQLPNHKK